VTRVGSRPAKAAHRAIIQSPSSGDHSGDQYRTREITRLELELSALRSQVTRLENKVAAASANAEHYSFLFNNSPVGDLVLDERGMILDSNRQARLMLGVNSARMLSGAFAAFVAKDEIPEFLNHLRRCSISQGTVSTELKLTLKPGRQLPVELLSVPIRGEVALVKKFRTLLIDISRRETAKTALQLTQGNYRALLDSLHGIVWEADPQTLDVLFVSQSAERLLGYSADIWYQPSFWPQHIHLADRDRILSELSRAVAAGEGHQALDYRMLDSQRRVVWVRDTLTVFKHQGKTRLLGVAVDITDRKELEARLNEIQTQLEQRVHERTAELSSTVSDLEAFSYSISHDLRAPLRAMEGYAQILQERLKKKIEPVEKDFLNRITASAQRLDSLIQDVLKYSRVAREPLKIEQVDIEELIEGIIRDYPNLQASKAKIELQKPLHSVQGNEAFLTQCVSNLLSNAVKFVQPGADPHVRVWAQELKQAIRLWFEDNGIGIAPENQRRIFGIFQRMHSHKEYEGTGIGLAIVKKAAERMGGRVGLESSLGHGSRFWLELPRA